MDSTALRVDQSGYVCLTVARHEGQVLPEASRDFVDQTSAQP